MKPEEISVGKLFKADVVFNIPLFQRSYVWKKEDQWAPLWADISRLTSDSQALKSTHFTGVIVIQGQNMPGSVPQYETIDGQQRLITFQLIFCAIREICASNGYKKLENSVGMYIKNQDPLLKSGEEYKLQLSKRDRDAFISLVDKRATESLVDKSATERQERIYEAYDYFFKEIKDYVGSDESKIEALFFSIRDRFKFIQILIEAHDDEKPERVFESLNARGKELLNFDLLKNNLFLRASGHKEDLYEKYWEDFEDPYWGREINIGNRKRIFCEIFLEHFLIAKLKQANVKPGYFVYERKYLEDLPEGTSVEDEFSELARYSKVYREIVDCDASTLFGNRMRFYETFNLTVLRPFILFLRCEATLDSSELDFVLDILESYTIRRMLCFGGTRGLLRFNLHFAECLDRFRDNNFSLIPFIEYLSEKDNRSEKYPTDNEIEPTMHTHFEQELINFSDDTRLLFPDNVYVKAALEKLWTHTGGQVNHKLMRYILYRIERMRRETNKKTEPLSFQDNFQKTLTLEHILPKAWKQKCSLPFGDKVIEYDMDNNRVSVDRAVQSKAKLYADLFPAVPTPDDISDACYRDAYNLAVARDNVLDSIGNLTLITRNLNSKLRNEAFVEKKELLDANSDLRLNNEICQEDVWDVNEIYARSDKLIADFHKIWPSLDAFKDMLSK